MMHVYEITLQKKKTNKNGLPRIRMIEKDFKRQT